MAYQKQNFSDGKKLTAKQLNLIDDGVYQNQVAIEELKNAEATGVTEAEKNVMLTLFKNIAYTSDMSAKVTELEALWSVSYKISYKLTGATASNNASAVVENGAYTSTLTAEGGYTLTGATVKVTMGGKDITSTAYSNGVITIASVTGNVVITVAAREIPSFSITNNLTNVANSNSAAKVAEGDFYSATLSWAEGYDINSITITMGGVDVTADVYGEGKILITEVTGNVVITAEAGLPAPVFSLYNRTFAGDYVDTGITLSLNEEWSVFVDAPVTNAGATEEVFSFRNAALANAYVDSLVINHVGGAPWRVGGINVKNISDATHGKIVITRERISGIVLAYGVLNGEYKTETLDCREWSITETAKVGARVSNGSVSLPFNGTVNAVEIHNRVLTEAEIKEKLGVA